MGSVDACIRDVAASKSINLEQSKLGFAIAKMKAKVAKIKAVQQRNLERRIMIEKRKSKCIYICNNSVICLSDTLPISYKNIFRFECCHWCFNVVVYRQKTANY